MRLVIEADDGAPTRLLIRDLAKVVVMGDATLTCGPQKTIRTVTVGNDCWYSLSISSPSRFVRA